ncbi:MAG: acyl-CoA thioesterase [Planctomycetales bacterium]|nr:acyl-CoA thioesterase [Planctomycetales bacterium]
MPAPFSIRRRVEFHDTDMAGIMHFTGFFRFMEAAEHAFLRQHGLNIFLSDEQGEISWPRVSASCDFRAPARFSDEVVVQVELERLGEKSATFRFLLSCDGKRLGEGHMTSVCCRIKSDAPPEAIAIPEAIRAKLVSA